MPIFGLKKFGKPLCGRLFLRQRVCCCIKIALTNIQGHAFIALYFHQITVVDTTVHFI